MKKKIFWAILIAFIVFVALGIIGNLIPQKTNAKSNSFEKYTNPKYGFALDKPSGWLVQIDPPNISLLKDKSGNTSVNLQPIFGAHPKMNAVTLASLVFRQYKNVYPGTRLIQALMNKDESLVQVTVDFTNENKVLTRSLYFTSLKNGQGLLAGYRAPKNNFDTGEEAFRKALGSFQVNPKIFYSMKGQPCSTNLSGKSETPSPTVNQNNLVMKSSPDGTVFVKCPPGWQTGGGEMYFAAEDPQSGMGVLMKNEYFPGGTHAQYLVNNVLGPFGVYNIRIISDQPNPEVGGGYNARNIEVGFTAQNGMQGAGYFAVVLTPPGPAGMSAITTQGFWAPVDLYRRNFSVLYAIALSIDINEALVNQKYQQLFARIQQTQRILAETSEILSQAVDKHMKDTNRIIDKYNDYLAGKQRYYSSAEDKVYRMSYYVGDYPENPKWPGETLKPVPEDKWEYTPEER